MWQVGERAVTPLRGALRSAVLPFGRRDQEQVLPTRGRGWSGSLARLGPGAWGHPRSAADVNI